MKRKTSKELLAESFRELAEQMPIDKITIQDIVKNCGYSPATFYRQFKDKYDLIVWDYSRDVEKMLDYVKGDYPSWKRALSDAAAYFSTQKGYIANLLLHTNGFDSFVRNMTEIHYHCFRKCILKSAGADRLDEKTVMYIRLYCQGTVALTGEWILGKYENNCKHSDLKLPCDLLIFSYGCTQQNIAQQKRLFRRFSYGTE